MANQNYTVGIDVDLKGATSGLAQMEAAAKRTTAAVSSLKNELKNLTSVGGVGGQKDLLGSTGLGEQGAKRITEGTKAMREATSAMKSLQSVQQSMANTDFSAATQNMTNALKGMQQALAQITPMDQRRLEMLSQQLPLMRQAADLALRQSQAENQLAQAKLRVAQAEGQNIRNAGLANTTQADLARNLETSAYAAQRAASYYGIFSTALAALPALAVKNAASQERAFADVQRTTQESKASLEGLRVEYQRMSTEVPVAFEQLATIGTLGAQMDIAKEDLAEFTRAVSGFSSITGETVESTAMAFGRLQNMLGGELKESAVGAGD